MKYVLAFGFALFVATAFPASPTWAEVEAEADLERQSRLALDYARAQVDAVVKAYLDSRPDDARATLDSIVRAVEVAQAALEETGKHPRKKPKHFKNAEIATRKLVKDLEQAQAELAFEERPDLDPVIAKLEAINRQLLMGIMRPKSR